MTKNFDQFYKAIRAQGVPHQLYFHRGGHGGAPPDSLINRWFTRYLWGVQNGVENEPRAFIVRETNACPPRNGTVDGDQSNVTTLQVVDSSQFPRKNSTTESPPNTTERIAQVSVFWVGAC